MTKVSVRTHPSGSTLGLGLLTAAVLVSLAGCGPGADAADAPGAGTPGALGATGQERPSAASVVTAEGDTILRRLALDLLPAISAASGLPVRSAVRLASRTRDELETYLNDQLAEDLPPEKARALSRAYARFGLIPDSLLLEPLLRTLLLEQVVGYYDPRRDTLYVMRGVPPAQVEAVLAHEIVHALQDQYVDLDSLLTSLKDEGDRSTAARAALEGHATYAMLEWQLGQAMGKTVDLTQLPNLSTALGADPLALVGMDMPVLREAPRVIRESLLFPYLGGLGFVQSAWTRRGARVPPLGDALPQSTEVILHPERYWPDPDDPTDVRFAGGWPTGWSEVYSDGLGEQETRILLEEFLPEAARAGAAAEGWDGDRYVLLEGPPGEVLSWITVWDSERDAAEFKSGVREALARRDGRGGSGSGGEPDRDVIVESFDVAGRPVVRVWDLPAGVGSSQFEAALKPRLSGGL